MQAYTRVGAPNLALWRQSLAKAEQALGPDHPRVWMHTREIYKKAGGGEVPGLNAKVGAHADEIELMRGIEVEKEHHTTLWALYSDAYQSGKMNAPLSVKEPRIQDAIKAITIDHLREIPDYYTRLAAMEAEAKAGRPDLSPAAIARSRRENPLYAAPGAPARAIKRVKGSLIHLGTKMRTIKLADDGSGMDGSIEALAAAADQDEKALLAGQDLWYPDEWRG